VPLSHTTAGENYYGHRLVGLDIEVPGALRVGHTSNEELGVTPPPGPLKLGQLLAGINPQDGKKP
jgi:hypothetical protein